MGFDPKLKPGTEISNKELCSIFKCAPQGGMRRSKATNTLCLISDHTKSLYDDKYIHGFMHYTGMGSVGNQSLEYMQNRTLNESQGNGVDVFLFEVFKPGVYTYIGQVELKELPYQESQIDSNGEPRKVWMFILGPASGEFPAIGKDSVEAKEKISKRKTKKLDDSELEKRALSSAGKVGSRKTISSTFERDPYVAEYTKRRANGVCQLCGQPAPFKTKNGEPYLEVHHIIWLSEGGVDTIDNTVALCPNCHRKVHVLNLMRPAFLKD